MNRTHGTIRHMMLVPALPLLVVLGSGLCCAATYFVDGINGNDANSGTSEEAAWQSVQKVENASVNFVAGDTVKFKRGQVFRGRIRYYGASGTADAPVTITAFGAGPRPVLTGRDTLPAQWTNLGNNKWSTPIDNPTSRLWKDGVEQKKAAPVSLGHTWEEFGLIAGISWAYDADTLYVYSDTNPSASSFIGNTIWNVIAINDKSYLRLTELDLRGAINTDITLSGSHHITIDHCNIGLYSAGGINLAETNHIHIEQNVFDSGFRLRFEGVGSYKGVATRGVNDAISSYQSSIDNEICYNDFIDWLHAGIALETKNDTELANYLIHHNLFTTPNISYGRGIAFSGTNVHDIEVYHNYFYDLITPNQLNGRQNHIHHNWFKEIKDTLLKDGEQGQAITLSPYNGPVTNNLIEYNTFTNGEGPCLELDAYGKEEDYVSNNTLRKNLFVNCGTSPWYPKGIGKGIYVQPYTGMGGNNFFDNILSSPLTEETIYHRDVAVTPEDFNDRDGVSGDTIHDNAILANLSDQGAGPLDISTIGADAIIVPNINDLKYCPGIYLLLR